MQPELNAPGRHLAWAVRLGISVELAEPEHVAVAIRVAVTFRKRQPNTIEQRQHAARHGSRVGGCQRQALSRSRGGRASLQRYVPSRLDRQCDASAGAGQPHALTVHIDERREAGGAAVRQSGCLPLLKALTATEAASRIY